MYSIQKTVSRYRGRVTIPARQSFLAEKERQQLKNIHSFQTKRICSSWRKIWTMYSLALFDASIMSECSIIVWSMRLLQPRPSFFALSHWYFHLPCSISVKYVVAISLEGSVAF